MESSASSTKRPLIRLIYLYLVALIGLIVFLMGGIGLVNLGFKTLLGVDSTYYYNSSRDICRGQLSGERYGKPIPAPATPATTEIKPVDTNSQEYKDCVKEEDERMAKQSSNDRRREIALALAQLILGAPIWLYHWRVVQQDHKQSIS